MFLHCNGKFISYEKRGTLFHKSLDSVILSVTQIKTIIRNNIRQHTRSYKVSCYLHTLCICGHTTE